MDLSTPLEGGLVLRRSTPRDVEALVEFNALVHGRPEHPDRGVAVWTRDLLTCPHPTFHEGGFLVVEDPATRRIVSSLNLIPQTWSYGGIRFGVGRVELVGTLPEYRRRGLIRQQMEEVHRWSAALGHPVQIITGIPISTASSATSRVSPWAGRAGASGSTSQRSPPGSPSRFASARPQKRTRGSSRTSRRPRARVTC